MNEPLWWLTKDGDRACLAMYERHYSVYHYQDGRRRTQFVGPGEKVVLRTEQADAIWVWRKFIDDSGQQGINCAVFRNESSHRRCGHTKGGLLIMERWKYDDQYSPEINKVMEQFVDRLQKRSKHSDGTTYANGDKRTDFMPHGSPTETEGKQP